MFKLTSGVMAKTGQWLTMTPIRKFTDRGSLASLQPHLKESTYPGAEKISINVI